MKTKSIKRFDPAILREDSKSMTENSRHFILNNGTKKAVFTPNNINYFDESKKVWSPIDSALKTSGDHYVASLGKYNVKIPKQSENETVEVSNDGGKIKWEYLGNKKSLFLPLECGTTLPSTKRKSRLKVNVVKNALLDVPTASHAIFKDAEGDIDLDYYIEGNGVKENIVIHDKGDDYHYYFLLRASGFRVKTKDNGSRIEFYKSVASGEDEPQTPEFVMPAPFMYDTNGAHSNAVKYSMERLDNENYIFEVCADETWINNSDRVFPICIDPHLVIPAENRITVTHEKYQWCECCCGSNTCLESEWVYIGNLCCGVNHIHLQSDDCNRIKAKLRIQKSGIDLTRNKVIKVTLKFNNISYTYNNRIRIGNNTYYTRSSSLNADITGLYNAATESFNVNMEMISTGSCIFNSMPTIEIDYQSICDDPVRKTLSVEEGVAAEFDVLSGHATVMIDDISDPILGVSVSHVFKPDKSIAEYGKDFRLNLDEKLVKTSTTSTGALYAYTDAQGDVHTFKEHFYKIGTNGNKEYLNSSSQIGSIKADADGRLWYGTTEVFRELTTDRGLRATSRLEGVVNNAEWVEQRIDEEKQAEEQVKGYKDTLCNFVSVNKNTGAISSQMAEWRLTSPDYIESFLSEIGCASHLLLSKEEALAYKSLLTQKDSLSASISSLDIQKFSLTNSAKMVWNQLNSGEALDIQTDGVQNQLEMLEQDVQMYEASIDETDNEAIQGVYAAKIRLSGRRDNATEINQNDLLNRQRSNAYAQWNAQEPLLKEQVSRFVIDKDHNTTYSGYGNGVLVRQYNNANSQISALQQQMADVNAQINLYVNKSPKYIQQFKSYYKAYLSLENQLNTLKLQIPVSYLISDSSVKGFNASGDLVVVQGKYGKYVVVEREKYNTSGNRRISSVSDQDGKAMTFSYNSNNKLSEICNSLGERVSFKYGSDGCLTDIEREHLPSFVLTYKEVADMHVISDVRSSNKTSVSFSYTSTGMLKGIVRNTTVSGISHDDVTDAVDEEITMSTVGIAYTTTETKLTYDQIKQEIYKINQSTELVDAYYEVINGYVSNAERYSYDNYQLTNTERAHKSCLNRYSYAAFVNEMVVETVESVAYNTFKEPTVVETSKYAVPRQQNDTPIETMHVEYIYNDDRKLVELRSTHTNYNNGVAVETRVSVEKRYYNNNGEVVREESYVEGEELKTGINIKEYVFDDNGVKIQSYSYNSLDPSSKFYTENEVDEKGKAIAVFDESGEHKTTFDYERDGVTVKAERLPNGSKLAYGRDKDGTVTAITHSTENGEENSNVQTRTLDVVTEIKSGNNTVKYAYDSKRRVKSVSLNGEDNYVTYAYSGEHTNAETVTATMKDGTVSKVIKNAHGTVSKSTCGNRSVTNTIDQDQQITKTVDSVSGTTNLAYDNHGNITSVSAPDHTESFVYDDIDHKLNRKTITVGGVNHTYQYGYKSTADKALNSITIGDTVVKPAIDSLGRNTGKTIEFDGDKIAEEKISYVKFGDHATNLPSTVRFATNGIFKESVQYKYDSMGNIIEVFENGRSACRYEYDALGRLTREDNVAFGKTTTWAYDNNGNILARYEYAITAKPTSELHLLNGTCKLYTYDDNSDQLMSYNDESFVYDVIGNPITYRGKTAVWEYGRQLKSYDGNTFSYDARGCRIAKNGITFIYDSNGNLIKQSNGLEFLYDHTGVFAVKYGNETYYYRKDAQGNIVELLDSNGDTVVKYKYDAWGKCQTTIVDSTATEIASLNPFRYRSYYYDTETGFYFLKTRYYDPEIGRFMTIDDISYLDPDNINGLNLYAYCGNDPVNNSDSSGTFAFSTFLIVLAASFLVTWAAGEIFGHQAIGGIGSIFSGISSIATGISMFAFGPVGWIIGGIAIIAGVASIAFGTAEIQEQITGNNWIKNSFGLSNKVYNGIYIASNVVAMLASLAGGFYRKSKISYGVSRADKTGSAYSRYYQMDNGKVQSITQYGKGGLPKYRIDVLGDPHFIKRIQQYALPHIHPFGNYNGFVIKKEEDTIRYLLWLLRGNWR